MQGTRRRYHASLGSSSSSSEAPSEDSEADTIHVSEHKQAAAHAGQVTPRYMHTTMWEVDASDFARGPCGAGVNASHAHLVPLVSRQYSGEMGWKRRGEEEEFQRAMERWQRGLPQTIKYGDACRSSACQSVFGRVCVCSMME